MVLGAVVQLTTSWCGTRRPTELLYLLVLKELPERHADDDDICKVKFRFEGAGVGVSGVVICRSCVSNSMQSLSEVMALLNT